MPAANIESGVPFRSMQGGGSSSPAPTAAHTPHLHEAPSTRRHWCCLSCLAFMWRLLNCFRSTGPQEQQHIARPRPLSVPPVNQYQAPVVTPSPRASGGSSLSSCDDDLAEQGTLLPKRRTPEPASRASGASGAAAAAAPSAAASDTAAREPQRHRRSASDSSRVQHVEGVRARVLTSSAATAAAAKAKFGTSEAELSGVTELLGVDVEDDDFCPTCLEAYTDDNPKIFTRCGHSFHMQCIYAWLERKATCPLCERPMDLQDDVLL